MILIYPIIVKPYLLKYLEYYNNVEPYFSLSEKSKIGMVLLSQLQRKTQLDNHVFFCDMEGYAKFKIGIPWRYQNYFGNTISIYNQVRFNSYLKKDFQEKLIEYVNEKRSDKKGTIFPAILEFREKYGISEDELPFKTMQKWWQREGLKNCA